jgi:hypothetical protein
VYAFPRAWSAVSLRGAGRGRERRRHVRGGRSRAETSEDAEVVGDQPDPPEPERVEQREHVGENIAHGVPVVRCVRPTSAAQVGRDHSVALGERRG